MAKRHKKTLDELKKYAWELACTGKTIPHISKKVNRKPRTVSRWLSECEKTLPNALQKDDDSLEIIKDRRKRAWETVDKLMDSAETPANVRAMLAIRVLNADGELIERKEMEHKGGVDLNLIAEKRKQNIAKGVVAFNVKSDT